ncbi:uncharacterized protein N0V89_012157 [Didymosphaeria variabile]|uniref:T6SS Phospholipase effector Tle1-like catalytic domain-containing protein n=1 Tax=Didymosphaeria variabile TaxID=1932322 RepID=A0A9W9C5V9_9PLEO|nr:uncharacterized protein N0V89_012157 [Didymosphaeria variabile]KAJ4344415.1 hypothetical protein N0V89_012157 [Didymosphaeria variabile]
MEVTAAAQSSRRRRKFILCFDGTGNKFSGTDADSNILKIYRLLDRNEDDQFHYYQPGIGTYVVTSSKKDVSSSSTFDRLKSWYIKAKDSAIGTSFAEHVMGGYKVSTVMTTGTANALYWPEAMTTTEPFLMRYYNPGDDVYFFGFSRGAYTARFLAEMLDHVGLLSAGNEEMYALHNLQTPDSDDEGEQDIKEVWFAGCHAMLYSEPATLHDYHTRFLQHLHSAATCGKIHDVLQFRNGATRLGTMSWNVMEYLPFRRMDLQEDGSWKAITWPLPKGEVRDIPDNALIHSSVIKRMEADSTYRPGNLIVGGGGRGVRRAPPDMGTGRWVAVREEGHAVGELFVRKEKPVRKKSEDHARSLAVAPNGPQGTYYLATDLTHLNLLRTSVVRYVFDRAVDEDSTSNFVSQG